MQFVQENNINYWPTPAESPDMNPIELLWHELKNFLRTVVKPKNKDEVVAGIQRFWDTSKVYQIHWPPEKSDPGCCSTRRKSVWLLKYIYF